MSVMIPALLAVIFGNDYPMNRRAVAARKGAFSDVCNTRVHLKSAEDTTAIGNGAAFFLSIGSPCC